jgi:sialidase-1
MYRRYIAAIFLVCGTLLLRAQQTPSHSDTWKGFERVFIKVGGHEGYYIKPANALPGNPWIWRASFPDWHTDMDSILLTRGMYVAFVSIDNRYGDPYAMQVWDKFYYYLTDTLGLARSVALEGVSRGGLYTLAWAKRNPDKVNFIYGETPVCDIESWPGGKGTGRGDTASWRQFKEVFNFTEEQALKYLFCM